MKLLKKINREEKFTLALLFIYALQLMPISSVESALFEGVDSITKNPLSPFTAFLIFVFRTPFPLIIYLTCLRTIRFEANDIIAKTFSAVTAAGITLNIYIFLILPLIVQYLINLPPATDEGAISLINLARVFLNVNLNVITPIIDSLFENLRLILIYVLLFRSKRIKSLLIYIVGVFILLYELLCFMGAYFELFDFFIFDFSPEDYNHFASFISSFFIFLMMAYLFKKDLRQRSTSND